MQLDALSWACTGRPRGIGRALRSSEYDFPEDAQPVWSRLKDRQTQLWMQGWSVLEFDAALSHLLIESAQQPCIYPGDRRLSGHRHDGRLPRKYHTLVLTAVAEICEVP